MNVYILAVWNLHKPSLCFILNGSYQIRIFRLMCSHVFILIRLFIPIICVHANIVSVGRSVSFTL